MPQGGPLSAILFNIAINFIYKEICDPSYSNTHGYQIDTTLDSVILSGFADDQAVTTCNIDSATQTIDLIQMLFRKIGLHLNPDKSNGVYIKDGKLEKTSLKLLSGETIQLIDESQKIKYLGCKIDGEIIFDIDVIQTFSKNCEKLINSSLLKPDQKLNIINQYLFPTLIYPLQAAPLPKISNQIIDGLDVMIRSSVKAIIGLPAHSVTAMLYSPRKLRGLGLLHCRWEVHLQHFAIAQKLKSVNDNLLHVCFDADKEINTCLEKLEVSDINTKNIRN